MFQGGHPLAWCGATTPTALVLAGPSGSAQEAQVAKLRILLLQVHDENSPSRHRTRDANLQGTLQRPPEQVPRPCSLAAVPAQ